MLLCATLTKHDLESVIHQITPLAVNLRRGRVVWLGRPSTVQLVANAGVRIRGDARFTWDVGGLSVPVSLRAWQLLLVPSFVERDGRHVLALDPVLEKLDFKSVPMFLDTRIAAAIRDGLAAQKHRFVWDFEKNLSYGRSLPDALSPAGDFELRPAHGRVAVTDEDVRLSLDFVLTVRRRRDASVEQPHSTEDVVSH